MELEAIKSLLAQMKALPAIEKRELNLFSIGARGHYENPTSDLLAFFLDPDAGHNLGSLVLEALLSCLQVESGLEPSLITTPGREVTTDNGKRIDILLESDTWVMVLENKIWHQQANPFDSYVGHIKDKEIYKNKQLYYVVLSPEGTAPKGWQGIAYSKLLAEISQRLGLAFIRDPLNKWMVLLREFVLHLESLVTNKNDLPAQTEAFVLDNLQQINEVLRTKNSVINALQMEYQRDLEERFCQQVIISLNHWYGFPALRFALSAWTTSGSDVVLYLSANEAFVQTYACNLSNDTLRNEAIKALSKDIDKSWPEATQKTMAFKVRVGTIPFDKKQLFTKMAECMDLLNDFEMTRTNMVD